MQSERFYAAIWEADGERIAKEPEYWKSREARVAANPSHEDLGGFLKDSAIVGELEKALAEPAERSKYLRYHLNVPLKTAEDPIIDMAKWQTCGGGVDLRNGPVRCRSVDRGLGARWSALFRRRRRIVDDGPDLGGVRVPAVGSEDAWTFLPFFWVPAEKMPSWSACAVYPSRRGSSKGSSPSLPAVRSTSGR